LKIYKLIYKLFKNSNLATFSKFCKNKVTYSQNYQDLFVLYFASNGSFIEIGASDGVTDNNTYLLENLGWQGICFEPNKNYSIELNKRNCRIDNRAVYTESGLTVSFSIDYIPTFSGIIKPDKQKLTTQKVVEVETISLNDVFKFLNCKKVTYLSLDTEGTELEILSTFNFNKYKIQLITVEHNGNLQKAIRIHQLLRKNGYIRVFKYISGPDFFYVYNS
jgi:FkbM family methyltransferase